MDKEEILKRSRNENGSRDEMERDTYKKAGQRACAVGGIVCAVLIIFDAVFAGSVSVGAWAVYLSMTGTMLISKYSRQRKMYELIFGLLLLILAAAFLIKYVIQFLG